MSNYTKTTDFDVKDSLPSGDTGKIIRGSEFEVEFENIEVAIASKADSLNTVLTGTTTATNLSVTGNTTLGNAASDTVTVNADFSSDLLPSADATYDLGAPGSEWQDLYVTGTANVDSLVADTVAISGGTITATLTGNVTGDLTGTVLTAAQPNITSVGSLLNLDVTGTTTTDALTVDTIQGTVKVLNTSSSLDFSRAGTSYLRATDADGNFRFVTGANDFATSRLAIANNGDISFYEDTGVTAKFFWDASAESLGIGTSSPSAKLSLFDAAPVITQSYSSSRADGSSYVAGGVDSYFRTRDSNVNLGGYVRILDVNTDGSFPTAIRGGAVTFGTIDGATGFGNNPAVERMRIDSSGQVGIGTSSPDSIVAIKGTSTTLGEGIKVYNSAGTFANNNAFIAFSGTDSDGTFRESTASWVGCDATNMSFRYGGSSWETATEHMVIDSSGNVGIGTSSPSNLLHVAGASAGGLELARFRLEGATNNPMLKIEADEANQTAGIDVSGSTTTELTFSQSGVERVRIDSSGNVGIGTDNPSEKLSIEDGDIIVQNDTKVTFGYRGTSASAALAFRDRFVGADRLIIDSSGNLLVSTATSPVNLAVSGSLVGMGYEAQNFLVINRNDGQPLVLNRLSTDGNIASFRKNGTQVGSISVTGTATGYNTSSDVRLKDNITDAPDGNIDQLKVRSFDWKADGSHQEYGFVAQELEPVAPYAVTKGETEDDMWSVDYSKLVPMLVKEIQDLKARIATLEAN